MSLKSIFKDMRKCIPLFLAALILLLLFHRRPEAVQPARIIYDTIVVRDTVRDTVPVPRTVYVHHYDTVYLPSPDDSVLREVTVPIERKEYVTQNYRAVVEGFSARLTEMELYTQNRTIVPVIPNTKRSRLPKPQIGIGIGVGYDPFRNSLHPVLTLGIYLPVRR